MPKLTTQQDTIRIGPYSQGEIPEPLVVTFKDANGDVIDLTSFSTVTFVIEAVDETVTGLGAGTTARVAPFTAGQVKYTWAAADFTTVGYYRGQFWVDDGTSKLSSDVFEWFVTDDTTAP